MARKKSRTPPPPRPVQAPKRRIAPRRRLTRSQMYLIALGAVILLAATGVISYAMSRSDEDVRAALAAGGCERESFDAQGRDHVEKLPKGFEYNSVPPTSGPHNGTPAIWDVYDEPVDQIQLVHNLEHGGVIVQYGAEVPEQLVQDIVAWYRDDPNGIIVSPLPPALVEAEPDLAGKIALTAWTRLQTCSRFSEEAFSDFRDTFRGNGPERFPVSALEPGSQ